MYGNRENTMSKEAQSIMDVEKTIRDLIAELEAKSIRFEYDGQHWLLNVTRADKSVAVYGRTLLGAVTDARIAYGRGADAPPF